MEKKTLVLDEVETEFLTILLVTDLMKNSERNILDSIGFPRIIDFLELIENARDSKISGMTEEEQSKCVRELLNKLLNSLNIKE